MFGFPPILDGNAGIKFTNNADSGFPKPGIREIFYSIKDGNWTDQTVWQTASGRVGLLPSANDDVYVRHTVALNTNTTVNNLFTTIFSVFTVNATFTLGINGQIINNANTTIINAGTINFLTQRAAETSIFNGTFNITSNVNTIAYAGDYSATIPSTLTTFHNLTISGTGTKTLGVNTTLNGNLTLPNNVAAILECSTFNLTVNGTTNTGQSSNLNYISKNSSTGTITFIGLVTLGNAGRGFDFSGNPNVEFRGGLSGVNQAFGVTPNTGTGTWRFTTNSQSFTFAGSGFDNMNASIIIDGITLTMNHTTGGYLMLVNNTINGTNASSNLILTGNFCLGFNNVAYALPMSTGTINTAGGWIQYLFNGNFTLPYTIYNRLTIGGTGIKTLGGNTTLNENLVLPVNLFGTLECSTFNLTVGGQTSINDSTTFRKSGAGNLTFIGLLRMATSFINPTAIDFSGNPNVELRGGIYAVNAGSVFTTGTGTFTFTTNNQSLSWNIAVTFNCNVLISGNIIISQVADPGFINNTIFNGTLNGDSAGSTYRIGASTTTPFTATYNNATQPMATGVLDTSTSLNTWIYGSGNQNVKGNPTAGQFQQYRNLTLNGGGNKTLQGNINVQNTYTVTAPAALVLNGYTKTP